MYVYEVRSVGIPECNRSLGLYATKEAANKAVGILIKDLANDPSFNQDYGLQVFERYVEEFNND